MRQWINMQLQRLGRSAAWFHRLDAWWLESIVIAAIISIVILIWQAQIDDDRSTNELVATERLTQNSERLEDLRNSRAERLENLRFVRDRSSSAFMERPFANLNLRDQSLNGLNLRGADLTKADLSGADLSFIQLESAIEPVDPENLQDYLNPVRHGTSLKGVRACRADFTGARLAGADMSWGNFSDADFGLADLAGTDLRGADLSRAKLAERNFDGSAFAGRPLPANQTGAIYDDATTWPVGFIKPNKLTPTDNSYFGAYVRTYKPLRRPTC